MLHAQIISEHSLDPFYIFAGCEDRLPKHLFHHRKLGLTEIMQIKGDRTRVGNQVLAPVDSKSAVGSPPTVCIMRLQTIPE